MLLMCLTQLHIFFWTLVCGSWITRNAQTAILWHEYMPRDVCATHPLNHRLNFVPSHTRLLSDAASVNSLTSWTWWASQMFPCIYPVVKCHWTHGNAVPAPPIIEIQRSHTSNFIQQELSYRQQIARQLRTQYAEGIYRIKYYTVTLKSRLRVTQGYWKRLSSSRVIWCWILLWPWNVALYTGGV